MSEITSLAPTESELSLARQAIAEAFREGSELTIAGRTETPIDTVALLNALSAAVVKAPDDVHCRLTIGRDGATTFEYRSYRRA